MNGSNILKIKFYDEFNLEDEINLDNNIKNKYIFKQKNFCQNCGIKVSRKFLDIHFLDFDINNFDNDNVVSICKDCHKIVHPKEYSDKSLIIVLPKNRLDHLSQAQIIYYFRYLYVLRYKVMEKEGILNHNSKIKTFLLFDSEMISEIFSETFEYFEELIDEIDDIEDEDEDFRKLIEPKVFWDFVNKYFSNDEDRLEEIEDEIIIFPLFEKDLFDNYLLILSLYNNLRNEKIKNDILNFIDSNKEFLNKPDALLEELNSNN